MSEKQDAIDLAEQEAEYWRSEHRSKRDAVQKAMLQFDKAGENLRTAEAFVQLLRARYGLRTKKEPRFQGWPLKDAALQVIREKRRITPQDVIAELQAGGYQFGDYPARRLHAALIHQKKAVRDPSGTWRWMAGEQTPLPLKEEAK